MPDYDDPERFCIRLCGNNCCNDLYPSPCPHTIDGKAPDEDGTNLKERIGEILIIEEIKRGVDVEEEIL